MNTTESCTNRRQHLDVQKQYNVDNVDEPVADLNPMVLGNINNRNQNSSSNPIINEDPSFLPEKFTKDDMKANVKQTNKAD